MINPQTLDLSQLPWLPLDARSAFPRNPAIYFAIDAQGVIQYIGRSVDPKQRWSGHHRYNDLAALNGVKIVYLFVDAAELLPDIESVLIEWFKPSLNGVKRRLRKSNETLISNKTKECHLQQSNEILTSNKIKECIYCKSDNLVDWSKGRKKCKTCDRTFRFSPKTIVGRPFGTVKERSACSNCGRDAIKKGLCNTCYQAHYRRIKKCL